MLPLANEVVLVTGASQGIGKVVAHRFARAGANLVLVARDGESLERVADEARGHQVTVLSLPCDVVENSQVEGVVARAMREFGKIDVLVNSAGMLGPIGPLVGNDLQDWLETLRVNLVGTVLCMRAVLPEMIARQKGCIINLSGGGAVAPRPRFSAYAASKAAVVRLTETLAEEVKEFNIRVNAIAPGAVNTRLLDQVLAAGERAGTEFYRKAKEQKEKGGTPVELGAELAVFLASPAAAGITGRLISAVWDDWKSLPQRVQQLDGSALFTLRRIDGRQFTEVK